MCEDAWGSLQEMVTDSFADKVSPCLFWHTVCMKMGGDLCHAVTSVQALAD